VNTEYKAPLAVASYHN